MSFCPGHLPPEEHLSTQSGPWALRLAHLSKYTEVWALGRRERPWTSFSKTREDLLVSPTRRRGSGSRSRWQTVGGRCDGALSRPLRSRRAIQGRWLGEEGRANQRGSSLKHVLLTQRHGPVATVQPVSAAVTHRGRAGGGALLSPSLSRLGVKPPHGVTSELLPAVSVSWAAK